MIVRQVCTVLAVSALAAVAALWAYYTLFSTFLPYDDEGFFLHAGRLLLAGEPFYTEIPWPYGPTYTALALLVHDLVGIPLTTDWARWRALAAWLGVAVLVGAWLRQQVRGAAWPVIAALLVMLYLTAFAKEPGHPQGLIACLTLLLPLLLHQSGRAEHPLRWLTVGAVTGLVLQLKLNAGLFCLGAAGMVLASRWRWERYDWLWPSVLLSCVALFPFILMSPLLGEPGAVSFALLSALTLLCVQLSLLTGDTDRSPDLRMVPPFLLGVAAVCSLLFALAWWRGATPVDIAASLLSYTGSQASFYHLFLPYSAAQLSLALLSLATVTLLASRRAQHWQAHLLLVARWTFCALTLIALVIDNPAQANALAGWAGPWCWVLLWGRRPDVVSGRQMLVALAAWFPLLAYPVPGSQIYFGSFLLIPLAILCLAELLNQLPSRLPGALVSGLLIAWLTALLGWQALQARERYQSGEALALPGAQQLRLPTVQAGRYRKLVAELDKSDVALATSGFNSLYLWSGATPPAPVLFNLSPRFLTPEQQQQIVRGLQEAERPVVLLRKARDAAELTTLERWVESHFRQTNKIGPYRVMRPGPAPAKSTDTKKGG